MSDAKVLPANKKRTILVTAEIARFAEQRRMALSKVLNAAAHGHIHETIGGSWNHYFANEAGESTDNVLTFAHEIQVRWGVTLVFLGWPGPPRRLACFTWSPGGL